MRPPPTAPLTYVVRATRRGCLASIDNRRLSRLAKLAGAPHAPAAGVERHVRAHTAIERDQPLLTIHAESPGELDYARDYLAANPQVIEIDDPGAAADRTAAEQEPKRS
jgi:thymidine phosphorylase